MSDAIEVIGLVKTFGRTPALRGLDLSVRHGEVHGFLGPNGSGKSTTLRILLGLLRADSGSVRLLGGDPWRDVERLHRRLAYVPGDVTLWPNLTGGEVIDLLGRLRGGLDDARRAELLDRFGLDPGTKARAYSKGNRQKVALVAALASDVDLLLLDEPTSGLDPLNERIFAECIEAERARGRTVLLSSHILSEVERLCDRVSIVKDGVSVEHGSLSELRHLLRLHVVAQLRAVPQGAEHELRPLRGVSALRIDGPTVACDVEPAALDSLLPRLTAWGLTSLTSTPATLEELFLRHYGPTSTPAADSVPA